MIEEEMEEVIEIEQNIMSGVDPERTEPILAEAILKQVQKFAKKHKDKPEVLFPIFSLLLAYYEVPDKAYKEFLNMLGVMSNHEQALRMVR